MFEHTDLKNGVIEYDNFTWLIDHSTFINNIDHLTEDLLQISFFENSYLIDVGWYSSSIFVVLLIKNLNWERPLIRIKIKTPENVVELIPLVIDLIYFDKEHS